MDDFIQFSLATIFYAVSVIFLPRVFWDSISFVVYLSNILFFLLSRSLIWAIVFCAASLIIFISHRIGAFLGVSVINIGHCLTLHNDFCGSQFLAVRITKIILL